MQGTAASLLLKRREALGLTQYEVARRAGVRESDISRWERGIVKSPPLTGMRKVCRVLEVPLEELADALLADEASAESSSRTGRPSASPESFAEGGALAEEQKPVTRRRRRSKRQNLDPDGEAQ